MWFLLPRNTLNTRKFAWVVLGFYSVALWGGVVSDEVPSEVDGMLDEMGGDDEIFFSFGGAWASLARVCLASLSSKDSISSTFARRCSSSVF